MNLSVEELITELSMTYSFRMHLLVEGDDDRKFFSAALKGIDKVNVVCCWGADTVSSTIREIDRLRAASPFLPTLGIVDRDYRIALGILYASPNLLASDLRDLECMMIGSPAFEAVLTEFGSAMKIDAFGGADAVTRATISSASHIGKLRFHSQRKGLNVSFQLLDISKILDRKTLSIDPKALLKHLNARQVTNGSRMSDTELAEADSSCRDAKCKQGERYFKNPLLLCRGHDLMEVLAVAFRSTLGSRSAAESSRENVESLFRLGYVAHFRNSQLATSIESWLRSSNLHKIVAVV